MIVRVLIALLAIGSAAAVQVELSGIHFDGLPDDGGVITPWAKVLSTEADAPATVEARHEFERLLDRWSPIAEADPAVAVAAGLSLLALEDITQSPIESEAPVLVYERLCQSVQKDLLMATLARFVRSPKDIPVRASIPEFALESDLDQVRERATVYGLKMLGRLTGKLPN